MRHRAALAIVLAQSLSCAAALLGGEITSGTLQIQGMALEVDTPAVTTGIDIPTTIQTKFGGRMNDAAPSVDGLLAVGHLDDAAFEHLRGEAHWAVPQRGTGRIL